MAAASTWQHVLMGTAAVVEAANLKLQQEQRGGVSAQRQARLQQRHHLTWHGLKTCADGIAAAVEAARAVLCEVSTQRQDDWQLHSLCKPPAGYPVRTL
jgi:hypothetical protein